MNSSNRFSIFAGIFIVLIGVITLVNSLGGNIDIGDIISTYWPILLIIWGVEKLFDRKPTGKVNNSIISILVLILGLFILGRNLRYYYFDLSIIWKFFWPALLIFIGISILSGAIKTRDTGWAIMGAIEKKNENWQLKSKSYIAFMGGVELDLTRANIPEGETYLDLTAVMGGIEIRVPENLNIICTGNSFLGGIDFLNDGGGGIVFSRKFEHIVDGEDRKLIISARAIMGGIDIKK